MSDFSNFIGQAKELNPNQYPQLLKDIYNSNEVTSVLQSHLDYRRTPNSQVSKSRLHPNGFLKISLWKDLHSQMALRLHIWKQQNAETDGQSTIHNHRWDFTSLALSGRIQFENFTSIIQPKGEWTICELGDADRSGEKKSKVLGRCEVANTKNYELVPGSLHSLKHTELHKTPSPHSFAATMILIGPPQKQYSHIVRKRTDKKLKNVKLDRALNEIEVVEEIEDLIDKIIK